MDPSAQTPWQAVCHAPVLQPGDIHVWHIRLDPADCRPDWLDDTERERLADIQDQALKSRLCVSRTVLRRLLADYLVLAPGDLVIRNAPGGKPRLARSELHFNLSHSGDQMLLGMAYGREIGVDIELPRALRNQRQIAQRLFSPGDYRILEESDFDEDHFFACWTRHEARQKCIGEGIFGQAVDPAAVRTRSLVLGGAHACVAWAEPESPARLRYLLYHPTR